MNNQNKYEFNATIERELYYNNESCYGIFTFTTSDNIPHTESVVGLNMLNLRSGTVVGNCQRLDTGQEYKIIAEVTENKNYGWQYQLVNIFKDLPKTKDDSINYLKSILTDNQAETLINAYPDIVSQVVEDTSFEPDYRLTPGIKGKTFEKIKNKILNTYVIADILALLSPLGVTFGLVSKIAQNERNASLLKQKLVDNPYQLIGSVPRLTFLKVDKFALELNPDLTKSSVRISSAIEYVLKEYGNDEGHTLLPLRILDEKIKKLIPQATAEYQKIIEEEREKTSLNDIDFLYIKNDKCGLGAYYKMEKYIYEKLEHIANNENEFKIDNIDKLIAQTNEDLGFKLSDEQEDVVKKVANNNVVIVSGKAGCVDYDTEFFNGKEWKKIGEWTQEDKVLQYNNDGTTSLVIPNQYIKSKAEYLTHFKTKYGIDQCLSDDHNVIYVTQKVPNVLKEISFKDLKNKHIDGNGFYGKFLTTFKYSGEGISLTNEEIRLMCMIICDGTYHSNTKIRVNLKKARKKERAYMLLNDSKILYDVNQWNPHDLEYKSFVFKQPMSKENFKKIFYSMSSDQMKIFCDEILHWDGSICNGRKSFSSRDKEIIDMVQFAFSSQGERVSIRQYQRNSIRIVNDKEYYDNKIDYSISITNQNKVALNTDKRSDHIKTQFEKYKTIDGYQYCFNVNSHMLVLRRNGNIFITGNSGKTSVIKGILNVYGHYRIAMCALSAKAAQRIKEVTEFPAQTIHRLLKFNGLTFQVNNNTPLTEHIIIIDESSMINTSLFYALLRALPNKCKVIIVGDHLQLPPIGSGNVFSDLLNKKNDKFINVQLTNIYRQALESGIVVDANNIRDGVMPFGGVHSQVISGDKKDMRYIFKENPQDIQNLLVAVYLGYIERGLSVDDISIVVPRKDTVVNSCKHINKIILNSLIPSTSSNTLKIGDSEFRVGCRVINTINMYAIEDIYEEEVDAFNGETGKVVSINSTPSDKIVRVDFGDKIIDFKNKDIFNLELGYCLTVHKKQGDQNKVIIVGVDKTHTIMLSSNLLYTAITRAEKQCCLIGQLDAFTYGVRKKLEYKRITFLNSGIFEAERI